MRSKWWQAVAAVGVLGGAGFAVLGIVEDVGLLVQAAILFVGAALTLRRWLAGVLVVGGFSLLEVVFIPFYDRSSAVDWIGQAYVWSLSVIGLVAAAGALLERRGLARGRAAPL